MTSITICDDSIIETDQILLLMKDFSYKNMQFSIQIFNSSLDLMKSVDSGIISDIYLLDIVMPGLSGIDIGTLIRQKRDDVCIIFITNSTEYALNAYKISALQYLIKPVRKTELYKSLNKAIQFYEKIDRTYILDTPDGKIPIKYKDIIFIEISNHVLNFHTLAGIINSKYIRVSFTSALHKILNYPSFIQSHRAYIINMEHVKKMGKKFFIMTNSNRIPISKSHQDNLTNNYKIVKLP